MNKNILVVSTFFEPRYNYMEVQIADTLNNMGYNVTVITTDRCLFGNGRINDANSKYDIIRIKKLIRITDTVRPFVNLTQTLRDIAPSVAFLIYPGHGLSYYALRWLPITCAVISTFEDRNDKNRLSLKTKIIKRILKRRWYKQVFLKSSIIAAATNQTTTLFRQDKKFSKLVKNKIRTIGLGYDSITFTYDKNIRIKKRQELNISNEYTILITATRIVKTKPIKEWLIPIINALRKNKKIIFFLVGFSDNKYSYTIKEWINSLDLNDRLIPVDMVDSRELNRYYNISDYSVWFTPTISIQQSMGTGMKVILPERDTLDHLIIDDINGYYYKSGEHLEKVILSLDKKYDRERVLTCNKIFSYEQIITETINSLAIY